MKQMIRLLILAPLLIVNLASAGGTFELKGKITGFTGDELQISDGINIYTVIKAKIDPAQFERLKNMKAGTSVDLWLSFAAVKSTRSAKL